MPASAPIRNTIDQAGSEVKTALTNPQAKALLAKVYRMLEQEERQEPQTSHSPPGFSGPLSVPLPPHACCED